MNVNAKSSIRQALRSTLWGAGVVAALLAVTACQPSGGDDAAAGPSGSASAGKNPSQSTESSSDSGTGSGSGAGDDATGDSGETSGGNGTDHQDCKVTDLSAAVELQDAAGETPRHFLLTVTNGSTSPCVLNEAPLVRLGAGNSAPTVEPLAEPDTEPVVVEGGGKAYAGLYVFGNDEGGEAEYDQSTRFTASLVAGEGTELSGTLVFDLPDGLHTVSYDDAARVNGWAGTEGLAMRPISQL
nr:DUF4232 domain-containing protein [Streptomyces sp. NBC_00995]